MYKRGQHLIIFYWARVYMYKRGQHLILSIGLTLNTTLVGLFNYIKTIFLDAFYSLVLG
jgi:hypothetical protein